MKEEDAETGRRGDAENRPISASPSLRVPPSSPVGLGVDIVETARIEASISRLGTGFLDRVFTAAEIAYCESMKFSARHYAARFAAKEAVSKAFGTGIGAHMEWRDIEVGRSGDGAPFVVLHGRAKELAQNRAVEKIMLSLSHADHYSVASVVLIGRLPSA